MASPDPFPKIFQHPSVQDLLHLYAELPDTLFWVKDRQLRIRHLNPAFAERVNQPESAILGKTDADFYFPELARVFMADDRQVIETGLPIEKKYELLANRFGGVEWRATTKLPFRDDRGRIIGTTGLSRPVRSTRDALPSQFAAFSKMVEHARERLNEGIGVEGLAAFAGMSTATLNRRFRQHMRISPGEFLAQLRVSRACRRLRETPLNVTEIALECGYESPAAFSRAFRRQMGMSPKSYREV